MTNHQPESDAIKKDAILIVDDDAFMLKLLFKILQNDYTLYQAGSAEAAVEILRGRQVKAVLCDYVLPGQNGLDFLITMKQRNPMTKSILFSASLAPDMFIKAINDGRIFRFVKKPASPTAIRQAVNESVRQYDIELLQQQLMLDQKEVDSEAYTAHYGIYRLGAIARKSFKHGMPLFSSPLAVTLVLGSIALVFGIGVLLIILLIKQIL